MSTIRERRRVMAENVTQGKWVVGPDGPPQEISKLHRPPGDPDDAVYGSNLGESVFMWWMTLPPEERIVQIEEYLNAPR